MDTPLSIGTTRIIPDDRISIFKNLVGLDSFNYILEVVKHSFQLLRPILCRKKKFRLPAPLCR